MLADWGQDDDTTGPDGRQRVLGRWGTHVMSYEPDLDPPAGRYLLWRGRYFPTVALGWADLVTRAPG